jgi:hypothetical protein
VHQNAVELRKSRDVREHLNIAPFVTITSSRLDSGSDLGQALGSALQPVGQDLPVLVLEVVDERNEVCRGVPGAFDFNLGSR